MITTRGRWAVVIIVGLVVVGLVYSATRPVLLRISAGPLPADWRAILLSPFRDREPEKIAQQFLDRLKGGDCQSTVGTLEWSAEKRNMICDKEVANPILSLRLIDRREEQRAAVTLLYLWYGQPPDRLGNLLQVQIGGERGDRRVVDYVRTY